MTHSWTQVGGHEVSIWVKKWSRYLQKSARLGPPKRVTIRASDDDTFLDPDGSPRGSQMGSNKVPLPLEMVLLDPPKRVITWASSSSFVVWPAEKATTKQNKIDPNGLP